MLGGTNSNSQLIKNLDVTLTENGTFVSGEDYTGFGTVTVAVPPDVMDTELSITPTKEDGTSLDPTYDTYVGPFIDQETGDEFAGAGNIKVRRIGSWIDSEISADNIRKDHIILGVKGNLIELVPQAKTTKSTTTQFTIYPDQGYNGLSSVTINPMVLQNVTHVTPKSYSVTVYKGSGYDGMNSVQIDAVTADVDSNIQPENIKKNVWILGVKGTYDNYVAPVVQPTSISPTTSAQTITPPAGVDGFNRISVDAVTAAIDPNIRSENIKRNVSILGVVGSYKIENLQDKTVTPTTSIQTVTFDDTYEGLGTVTVNAVTSSIDPNIKSENIKKDVTILGVIGTNEGEKLEIEPAKTVAPATTVVSIQPSAGYDVMSEVNISAVTASIDPNILAANIKKNIEILGVTGSYEGIIPNYQQSKTVEPSGVGDVNVNPDPGYDALLKVIVKAVTASIDPNIIPKNIRKDISILGITGTLEEGLPQQWFYFKDTQAFNTLGQVAYSEGGNDIINKLLNVNSYSLVDNFERDYNGLGNFRANFFSIVYGYDDEYVVDPITYESYIYFTNGRLYLDYDNLVIIPDQTRYFYPFINDYGVPGLTIGLDNDDGSSRVMKLYVLTDSTEKELPVPVLVNGVLNLGMIPSEYDGFRFVKDIIIPAHRVYIPKVEARDLYHWVTRDEDLAVTKVINKSNMPNIAEISAYDLNHNQTDFEINILGDYKLKNFENLRFDHDTLIASQRVNNVRGYIQIPGTVTKKDGYCYYFKFRPHDYTGYNQYFTLFDCNSLFKLGLYRPYSYGYYYIGYVYNWTSSTGGNWTTSNTLYTWNTYWFRVRVNGTTTGLDYSTNGITWTNFANVSSSYINPTNTNTINIYALEGINNDLGTDGIYITDNAGNKVYSVLEDINIKKTSHDVVPLTNNNLLVARDESRISYKHTGNENISNYSYNSTYNRLDLGTDGYIEIPDIFTPYGKTWEIGQHFRLNAIINNTNRHLATWNVVNSSDRRSCLWVDTSNVLCWRVYGTSDSVRFDGSVGIGGLTADTDYYIRYGYDGGWYYLYLATDKNFTNLVGSWSTRDTYTTYCEDNRILLCNWIKNHANGSTRYLYLDDSTYIKIANEIVWKPEKEKLRGNIVNYSDDGTPTTLDLYLAKKENYTLQNGFTVGIPTISNLGIASGFTSSTYISPYTDAFNTTSNFEIVVKFMLTATSSNFRQILSNFRNWGFCIGITGETKLHTNLGNGDGTWGTGVTSSQVLSTNTWYWVKVIKSGSTLSLYHSTDNETWVSDGSVSNSYTSGRYNYFVFGLESYGEPFTNGYIDLQNSYIKVDDKLFWQSQIYNVSQISVNTELFNVPLLSDKIAAIDKFNKQYLSIVTPFKPETNTWEICAKYKLNSLFGCVLANGYYGEEKNIRYCVFVENDGTIWLGLSSTGETWDICDQIFTDVVLSINTWYYIKLSFDGIQYILQISQDNSTWTNIAVVSSAVNIYDISDNIIIGTNPFSTASSTNIDGFVDLKECYAKINNQIIWEPSFRLLQNYDWIISDISEWTFNGLTNLGKKGEVILDEHNIYQWDQSKIAWRGLKQFTFNLDDSDAILYTEIEEH